MMVGNDITVLRDDDARTARLEFARHILPAAGVTLRYSEKFEEGVYIAHLHLLRHLDVDHCIYRILGGIGQVGIIGRLVGGKVSRRRLLYLHNLLHHPLLRLHAPAVLRDKVGRTATNRQGCGDETRKHPFSVHNDI